MTPETRLEAIQAADLAGEQLDVLPFWGHRAERDGSVGRGCFSQWWPAEFTVDEVRYPTAEHWMMAAKARLFGDDDAAGRVLAAGSPGAAKAIGRTVRGFDQTRWEAARYGIVLTGTAAKFGQHPELRDVLHRTGSRILAEASPVDPIWGIGLPPRTRLRSPDAMARAEPAGFRADGRAQPAGMNGSHSPTISG